MLEYKPNDLRHNIRTIIANKDLFIEELAKRKQYQIAKDMGLTSTQMSFFISIFWAWEPLLKDNQAEQISNQIEKV